MTFPNAGCPQRQIRGDQRSDAERISHTHYAYVSVVLVTTQHIIQLQQQNQEQKRTFLRRANKNGYIKRRNRTTEDEAQWKNRGSQQRINKTRTMTTTTTTERC